MAATSARKPRSDGARNRELLLDAAAVVFAKDGARASLDEIAAVAGVANATLYRHFPTRQQLIAATFDGQIAALCAAADGPSPESDQEAAQDDALGRLRGWLAQAVEQIAASRGLSEAFIDAYRSAGESGRATADAWHVKVTAACERLLTAAVRAGQVRHDLGAADLMALIAAIAQVCDGDATRATGMIDVLFDGLSSVPG